MKTALVLAMFALLACESTYKRATMVDDIKNLAKKEYNLDVEVKDLGSTIGVQYRIKNMLGELVAEDQLIWKQMEDLMMVLSRVMLSADEAAEFIVLDIVDEENPNTHLILTRYSQDVKKLMGEAISRSQFLDRLLMEFVIGGKRTVFDPYEMDIVRLMMMAMDSFNEDGEPIDVQFELEPVDFSEFLAKVAANKTRRNMREKKELNKGYILREVTSVFEPHRRTGGQFKILLDLVSKPNVTLAPGTLDKKILPFIAKEAHKIFKSYKFSNFTSITVIDKNSGKMFLMPRK